MTQSQSNPITKAAQLAGVTPEYVDQIIDQVQKLIDNGMWFSDACEVVAIVTDFKKKAENFGNERQIAKFWDFVSDNCCAKPGVEPLIDTPMW